MENINSKFINISVKYGFIVGICYIAFTTIIYVFDISMFSVFFGIFSFLFTFGLIIILTVFSINETKKKILNGSISYLECLIAGFITGVIAFYISGAFNYILYGLIDKDYIPQQIEKFAEMLQNYNLDESKIQEQVQKMSDKMQPLKQFTTSLYSSPIISLVISAIISIFIKKKDENIILETEFKDISKD